MKKILITFLILFLLAIGALAAFIATFNAERYRPLIETKAAELTGFPVKLGGISLAWKNGLALEVHDVVLKVRESDSGPAPVFVRSAFVALEVMPLLRGTIQMGSIVVEGPEIRVERTADGRLLGAAELGQTKPATAPSQTSSGAESALALLIQNMSIRDGKFLFHDETGGKVTDYQIDQIELHLQNVSLLRPFPVQFKASAFSTQQNLDVSGKVHLRLNKNEILLQDFAAESDLSDLDAEKLAAIFPGLDQSDVPQMAGKIRISLDNVTLSEEAKPAFNAQVTLSEGRLAFPDTAPLEEAALAAVVTPQGLKVTSLSGNWGGGQLTGFGNLDWNQAPMINFVFQVALSDTDLQKIVPPPAHAGDPGITGILSANLKGSFAGPDADVWMRTLKGDGQVAVKDGVITNLNILREVMSKLSFIPAISQKLQERLSDEYRKKLEARDTQLAPVDLPVRLADGFVYLDSIDVVSDTFRLTGRAQAALSGSLNGRVSAAIDPEFSLALTRSIRELEYLADQKGQITIPVVIQGTTQKPQIFPDIQDVGSRLAIAKTQELLSNALGGKKKETETGSAASATDTTASQVEPQDPFAALLGQVLQAASKKKE